MGFLRWEPLPSRHESHRVPLPLPAAGATSRGSDPRARQGCNPPASCACSGSAQQTTVGSALLREQLVLMLCGGISPPVTGCQAPPAALLPGGPDSQPVSPQFPSAGGGAAVSW